MLTYQHMKNHIYGQHFDLTMFEGVIAPFHFEYLIQILLHLKQELQCILLKRTTFGGKRHFFFVSNITFDNSLYFYRLLLSRPIVLTVILYAQPIWKLLVSFFYAKSSFLEFSLIFLLYQLIHLFYPMVVIVIRSICYRIFSQQF